MRESPMLLLITGATGKVGTHLISKLKALPDPPRIRAMCHNRGLASSDRFEVVTATFPIRLS